MNLFFQKIKNFLRLDIRWKLIKIKLYPKKIYKKGVRYLYSKFIFNLVFLEKSKTVKKVVKPKKVIKPKKVSKVVKIKKVNKELNKKK